MTNYACDMTTELREHMRGGKGTVEVTKLSNDLPSSMRLFARLTLKPGCSIGFHVHEHETELFAFVSGVGTVTDDEATHKVKAGDSMLTFPGHGHAVENTGTEDLVLIASIVKE